MTEAEFAQQLAYIAGWAARWAGDCLTLQEHWTRPASAETVARFTDGMRERLNILDKAVGRPKPDGASRV